MKIIQVFAAAQEDGHVLYGLDDDGCVYEYWCEMQPRVSHAGMLPSDTHFDGRTAGWHLLAQPCARSRPVPHPDDPTRHERS